MMKDWESAREPCQGLIFTTNFFQTIEPEGFYAL